MGNTTVASAASTASYSADSMAATVLELRNAISQERGWGSDYSADTTAQKTQVNKDLKRGLRQFYMPQILPGDTQAHSWSFLSPVDTLYVYDTIDGTIHSATYSGTTDLTTIVAHESMFYPSMEGATLTSTISAETIYSYSSATTVTIDGDVTASFVAGGAMTVSSNGIFALPTEFGGMLSDFTYEAGLNYGRVKIVGEASIRDAKQRGDTGKRHPVFAAVRPRAAVEGMLQRFEIITDPSPDSEYTWSYKFRVQPMVLDDTNTYPYGADMHGETILASCLAAVEAEINPQSNARKQRFMELLSTSVAMDRRMMSPSTIGMMDPGTREVWPTEGTYTSTAGMRTGQVTFEGTLYGGNVPPYTP